MVKLRNHNFHSEMIQLGSWSDLLCTVLSKRASNCEQIFVFPYSRDGSRPGESQEAKFNLNVCRGKCKTKRTSKNTTDSLCGRFFLNRYVHLTVEADERIISCGLHENDKHLARESQPPCLFQTIHYVIKQASPFLNVLFSCSLFKLWCPHISPL